MNKDLGLTETKREATMPRIETREAFQHDVCPKCGCASLPFEGVPDQALRGCPRCLHEWFEDLNSAPITRSEH